MGGEQTRERGGGVIVRIENTQGRVTSLASLVKGN